MKSVGVTSVVDITPRSLPQEQAHRFFNELAEAPFIALVLSDGDVRVYTKGLDDETMEQVSEAIRLIISNKTEGV